ncbi:MAG TPA: hypothetical protein VFN03_01230, partial [Trueperaceae bacterium]|nr:hypothetical protein [Trueperaceae bacterium]
MNLPQSVDWNAHKVLNACSTEPVVDPIISLPDGKWAAVEVKLGFRAVEAAAASLQRLAKSVHESVREPVALVVITGSGF